MGRLFYYGSLKGCVLISINIFVASNGKLENLARNRNDECVILI